MLKISKKIIFMIFLFFISNSIVKADIEIISGGLSQGSNSDCSKVSGYVACYSPKFQFRVTLVDENGNKVNGTNSVDFTYSKDDKVEEFNVASLKGKKIDLINSNYQYKYGSNNTSTFKYVQMKIIEGDMSEYRDQNGKDDHSKYDRFFNEFISNVTSNSEGKRKEYISYTLKNRTIKYDFLSVFAYLSGYTKQEIDSKGLYDITIDQTTKAKEIADNNYFLLIEPTFVIYYNTTPNSTNYIYKYGTGQEIVKWLKNEIDNNKLKYENGYLAGLSLNFVYQASCNLHTTINNNAEFKKITGETNCSYSNESGLGKRVDSKPYPIRSLRTEIMNDVIKTEKGYGIYTLNLKNGFGIIIKNDPTLEYEIDLCNKVDGEISLKNASANKSVINEEKIKNKLFLVNGTVGETSAVYCYDNVTYNFGEIIKQASIEKFGKLDTFTIPNGTVTIDRTCFFPGRVGDENGANFDTYKNKLLKLKIFNQTINLVNKTNNNYKMEDIISSSTRKKLLYGQTEGWTNYTLTLEFGPEEGNETIQLTPSINYDGEAYIDFSNYTNENLFGSDIYIDKSNNIITNAFKAPITINDLQIKTTINSNDERKCKFNYTIDDTPLPFNGEGLQFRVISLSNPFPARDGTSRLPGTNWLDAKNYVYDYIDNNRAIQYKLGKIKENTKEFKENGKADPNAMYTNTEPMYVIDLDASTMKKIREYNKDHTYTDIKLTCDSNNRQCTSDFLRNELEGVNIPIKLTGVCSNKDDYNEVLVNYNGITEEGLRKVIYGGGFYQKSYDINKNLRNDTDDLEIFLNKDKNTFFYTCADKSYLSGG